MTAIRGGTYMDDYGRRHLVMLEAELRPAQSIGRGQTVDHLPVPMGALEFSVSGLVWDACKDGTRDMRNTNAHEAGQVIDALREVHTNRADRMVALWDRWHLNGMRAGCAHQGEAWTCSKDLNAAARKAATDHAPDAFGAALVSVPVRTCGTLNGWPVVRAAGLGYPKRGDQCVTCGRNRWDEPSDACPVSGYQWGRGWLYEPIPADALAELVAVFGVRVPTGALAGDPL